MINTRKKNNPLAPPRGSWKSSWRTIGGKKKFFRSRWEANYARYLELLKLQGHIKDWLHEPKIFWFDGIKKGCTNYTPDYQIFNKDGTHYWVEVKGWMCPRSKTKIRRFKKYFPDEKLIVVDADWFKKNNVKCRIACPDWE